jgi:MFS family permease
MKEYGLSPIQVNILFLCQPIVVMLLSVMSQQSSKWLGRMPIIVTTRIFATLCLLLMSFTKPIHLQILLFLLRGGTMRCSQPLRRSLLMDHVPKEYRARWNALENVAVFSWSGSAVLGGYLIDRFDYRSCFFITSIVYFFGVFMELLLIPLTRHAVEH